MPNWCSTDIYITNQDSDILKNLESEFDKAFKWNKIENGFGNTWLGNIFGYLGYDENEILHGDMKCRGEVTWMELCGNTLRIDTETAWTPMFEPILKMVEKYAPDSDITYYAVEEGCEIHSTNDDAIVGTIYVDVYDILPDQLSWLEEVNDSHLNKDEFLKSIAESMEWNISENEITKKVEDVFGDKFSYSEWEYTEIDEWK